MSAIKDEGLGMSEKPDWIVVRGSRGGGDDSDGGMQGDMTFIISAEHHAA